MPVYLSVFKWDTLKYVIRLTGVFHSLIKILNTIKVSAAMLLQCCAQQVLKAQSASDTGNSGNSS